MPATPEKIFALLIDADNVPPRAIDRILKSAKNFGHCSIRRAYGDWSSPLLRGWKEILHTHAITPEQQFACTVGKNNTDVALVIDAMDLLHNPSRKLDGFFLASSDSDFTPLAIRIRTAGLMAIGFGDHHITSHAFTQACDSFVFFTELEPLSSEHPFLLEDEQLGRLVLEAMNSASRRCIDGWLPLAVLGSALLQRINVRQYGFSQLNQFLKAKCAHALEFQTTDGHIYVRAKEPELAPIPAPAEPDVFVRLGKTFDVPPLQ